MSEQEKKWGEEAKEYFNKLDDPCNQGSYFYYVEGYLQACRNRKGDEIILELAFAPPDGKFSGIIVGDRLIETGEVVEYIKKEQDEIERLKEALDGLKNIYGRGIIEELKRVKEWAEKIPYNAYNDALREGLGHDDAWGCFVNDLAEHIKKLIGEAK